MAERPQRAAGIVEADLVRKPRPGEGVDFQNVVQEFDQLVCPGANLQNGRRLFDRRKVISNMMHATAGGADNIIEALEIAGEQRLGSSGLRFKSTIGHRLAAAGLFGRIDDVETETLE